MLGYEGLSRRLERSVFTAPMLFLAAGLLAGTEVLGWLDLGIERPALARSLHGTMALRREWPPVPRKWAEGGESSGGHSRPST